MDTENYISPSKITKQFDITSGTLRRWAEAGKIRFLRPNGGKRIYNIEDVNKMFSIDDKSKNNESKTDKLKANLVNLKDSIRLLDSYESIGILESEIIEINSILASIKTTLVTPPLD